MEEHTSHKKEHHSKNNFTEQMRKNPWILSTLVLGVVILILLVGNFGGATGNGKVVSQNDAGKIVLDFANTQVDGAELVGVEEESSLYKVTLSLEGRDIPVYLTLDGENLVSGLTPLSALTAQTQTETQTTEVPKTDKPVVELFIWGYCPYGVQAQGPLSEVAKLLGNDADFKAVLYYDGHGAFETQENKIQECIQEIAPDKYWDYASGFVSDIYSKCGSSRDVDCDKTEATTLMKSLGIDSAKVFSCVDEKGEDLLSSASARASQLGVTGSPTLVINGVKTNTARTAEAYKTAICNSYTDGNAPSECSTELDNTAANAAGNC